ncbi:MAG: MFS transporter [Chloroflexota bacterium]
MNQHNGQSSSSFHDSVLNALPEIRRRITWSLFTAQSLYSASQIASFVFLSILSGQLSGNPNLTGAGPTILMIGRAAAGYPIGWLMDRVGRRLGLTLGYLLAVIGSIGIAVAIGGESFIGFCVAIFLTGMGRGVSEQARFTAAEVQEPSNRAKVIGWIVFAGTIGAVGGPLLVAPSTEFAAMYGLVKETGPYLIAAVMTFVSVLITFFMLRPDPLQVSQILDAAQQKSKQQESKQSESKQPEKTSEYGRSVWTIFAKPRVLVAMTAMTMGQLTMNLLMVIAPVHMDHHGHGAGPISTMIMAHTIGMFGLASITGWLVDRLGTMRMIVFGSLILILAAIVTPLFAEYYMMHISMFLLGLGWNFCFIAGSTLLSRTLEPNERGRIQGASETLIALAAGVASASTGVAFAQGGIIAVMIMGSILAMIPFIAVLLYSYRLEVLKSD